MKRLSVDIMDRIEKRLETLYGHRAQQCIERLYMMIGRYGVGLHDKCAFKYWDQTDVFLITYGDMVQSQGEHPLITLKHFLDHNLQNAISTVHILPFYPYSSDDGFSVIDYRAVNPALGDWQDVHELGENFRLMFDLVINHVSKQSSWFKDYVSGVAPGRHYFIEVDPDTDLSAVVRPRSLPLLTRMPTRGGEKYVWSTFSSDQIDLNFMNTDVLFEFIDILFYYAAHGARVIRLDAIAYLWKEIGTSCIHLPQTHEIVKLLRDILEMAAPDTLLITETNVPHEENVSYFGNGHEAHIVYQFSLPPLLLHALLTANAQYLTAWVSSLEHPPLGCTYLNFTASHDGIGVRPLEGIIPDKELDELIDGVKKRGGQVSMKKNTDGSESPYELNITYFDALGSGDSGKDKHHLARFLCSQTVAMELKGIPAVYFHSLTGTRNYNEGVEKTGRARTINRMKWDRDELNTLLQSPSSHTSHVFHEYVRLLRLRTAHRAFHPDAAQHVIDLGRKLFAVERISSSRKEHIVCISNFGKRKVTIEAKNKIPALSKTDQWHDIIGDEMVGANGSLALEAYQTVWLTVS